MLKKLDPKIRPIHCDLEFQNKCFYSVNSLACKLRYFSKACPMYLKEKNKEVKQNEK